MKGAGAGVPLPYHTSLIEVMADAVVGTDAEYRVTIWNPAAERLYGYTAAEAMGRFARELATYKGDQSRFELENTLDRTGTSQSELVARRKDGSYVDVEVSVTVVRDAAGTILGYLGIHRDITERRRAADEHRRLSALVENSPDFIGLADLDGNAMFVNEAGQRLVGLNGMDEVRSMHVLDFFPAADRDRRQDVVPRLQSKGRVEEELDLAHVRTGERLPVSLVAFRVDDPRTGEPIGLATITRDLSERRRAEAELESYRRRIDSIFASISDGFYALDVDLRFAYLNDRAVQVLAELRGEPLGRDDLLGAHVFDVFPESVGSDFERGVRRALAEHRTVSFEAMSGVRSNRWFDVQVYAADDGLAVYFRDITERRAADAARKRQARQQAATAELGMRASRAEDLGALMNDAVAVIASTLEVELVAVTELLRRPDRLLLRAGAGWSPGRVGRYETPAEPATAESRAAETEEPVVWDDVADGGGLAASELMREHGVTGAAAVAIPGRRRSFGAIGVFSRAARRFTPDEVNFLRAIANVLSSAIDRAGMAQRVREVREAERRRIARTLHDETLQELGVALAAASAPPLTGGAADDTLVAALQRVGEQIRAAIDDLRLSDAHERPFPALLDEVVAAHRAAAAGSELGVELRDVPQRLPGEMAAHVLRFIGEALTNVRRHAGASRIELVVEVVDGELIARVTDDGRGFDPEQAQTGGRHGLRGMRERAELLGGELDIRSRPGGETVVALRTPLVEVPAPSARARVLVVEDHAAVREALALAFVDDDAFVFVGQAGSLAEARTQLKGVDVAIIDLGLPDGDGSELIAELREASPDAQALVLSALVDRASTARAVERGAAGVLGKATHLHEVVAAVHRLRAGQTLIPLDEMVELLRFAGHERERELDERRLVDSLTPREHEVLQLLADGLDGRSVAAQLHISPRTQRNHVANILAKLGVHSQLQALVFALRHGVVDIPREPGSRP